MRLEVISLKGNVGEGNSIALDNSKREKIGTDKVEIRHGGESVVYEPVFVNINVGDSIMMDGRARQNLGVEVEEEVFVEEFDGSDVATEVEASVIKTGEVQGGDNYLVRETLSGSIVSEGEEYSPNNWAGDCEIIIQDVKPENELMVDEEKTDITIVDEDLNRNSPKVMYSDVGGMDEEIEKMREMVELPLKFPKIYETNGISKPTGVLLHGPPGTGKTYLARATANETDVNFEYISGPEIISKYRGETSEQLGEVFDEAAENSPSIIFIDEIDSIATDRGDMDSSGQTNTVAQLLSLMDGLDEKQDVIVIGATNRVNALDDAIRRSGRFDREIRIGVPDEHEREEMLEVQARGMSMSDDIDIGNLASKTHGYVASDLDNLVREAGTNAISRMSGKIDFNNEEVDSELLESLEVNNNDFIHAMEETSPSAMREFMVKVPDVRFDDVGGLEEQKKEVKKCVTWPIKHEDVFNKANTDSPNGILLHGPPGTGKTLLAKAIANEAESNFISVNGPEVFNKYVGESEKKIREVFEKARQNSPCIVFFDEIDAITGQRGSGGNVEDNVVSQLLTEMDGVEGLNNVFVMASTNRVDMMDPALLRPGRLSKKLEIPNPGKDARKEIFQIHTEDKPVSPEVSLSNLAAVTNEMSGSEIEGVCREASMLAIEEHVENGKDGEMIIEPRHFEQAISEVSDNTVENIQVDHLKVDEETIQESEM
jgi:transitional endoplasmic reticulum ATPase